ncbi:MAG: nucleotidyltransferase [Chloroflexi bacterium]|nr:nucleotidyltransferase [Chloroflexota bacterium]
MKKMEPTRSTKEGFRAALKALKSAGVPFLVGGAYAVDYYTGYLRYPKFLDIYLRQADVDEAVDKIDEVGFASRNGHHHWLAKASKDDNLVNLIFGFGNWTAQVDDSFFQRGTKGDVLGVPIQLLAPEEIIWFSSFIASRERFEATDIVHLIHGLHGRLDWSHLLKRLDEHWQLLFANVLLFGFVFPGEKDFVPAWLVEELAGRMQRLMKSARPEAKECWGILLDRYSFVSDIEDKGYGDPRERLAVELGGGADVVAEDRIYAKMALQPPIK